LFDVTPRTIRRWAPGETGDGGVFHAPDDDRQFDHCEVRTPGRVAELFAVSPRTVRRWADAGIQPSFQNARRSVPV
jgi:hypothetical protein